MSLRLIAKVFTFFLITVVLFVPTFYICDFLICTGIGFLQGHEFLETHDVGIPGEAQDGLDTDGQKTVTDNMAPILGLSAVLALVIDLTIAALVSFPEILPWYRQSEPDANYRY